ncbi:anthranilate synthase component I [Microbaculum marinum]|uniref:Anthranilate synthase component 1 n=1 Tax=Microbaculum marinum TaxID=1764581 RepID=A0AAW9RUW8_9HYPH
MGLIEPAFDAFEERYRLGAPQVVWTRLVADLETPVSAMLKVAGSRPNSFLLESVEGGAVRGRYSIIGMAPDLVFRAFGNAAEINASPDSDPDGFAPCPEPTLAALRRLINEARVDLPEGLPPMSAGVFGYMGYDTVRLMEELAEPNPDPFGLPDAMFIRPTVIMVFDTVKDEVTVVTPVRPSAALSAKAAHSRAIDRIAEVIEALDRPVEKAPMADADDIIGRAPVSNTTPAEYKEMVAQAKEYIAAGDVFQVVLSQRFEAPFSLPPFALYRALRRVNPAPFLYFLNFRDFAVVGSSPEILVRLRDDTVTIRPIAGTRPRGATPGEDKAYADELLADPKERAEHLMLLDLGRNDVGRVAKIGTVSVTDRFFLEFYSQVMHIVSNVEGRIDPSRDSIDALIAGFPAGTVSGAPKVRAMQIIDELEKEKRGIYAGCVGYFSADGDMDTCIVLRTAIVRDGTMYVQAGAGIVADSVPENEQRECINKARALFRAADEAVRFASAATRGQ